eukprot:Rmarinus@m.15470
MMEENSVQTCAKIMSEFYHRALQMILQARYPPYRDAEIPTIDKSKTWFNLAIPIVKDLADDVEPWRHKFKPMAIDIYADRGEQPERLLLERWLINFNPADASSAARDPDRNKVTSTIYKKALILVRTIFCALRSLPAYKVYRECSRRRTFVIGSVKMSYRIFDPTGWPAPGDIPIVGAHPPVHDISTAESNSQLWLPKGTPQSVWNEQASTLHRFGFGSVQSAFGVLRIEALYRKDALGIVAASLSQANKESLGGADGTLLATSGLKIREDYYDETQPKSPSGPVEEASKRATDDDVGEDMPAFGMSPSRPVTIQPRDDRQSSSRAMPAQAASGSPNILGTTPPFAVTPGTSAPGYQGGTSVTGSLGSGFGTGGTPPFPSGSTPPVSTSPVPVPQYPLHRGIHPSRVMAYGSAPPAYGSGFGESPLASPSVVRLSISPFKDMPLSTFKAIHESSPPSGTSLEAYWAHHHRTQREGSSHSRSRTASVPTFSNQEDASSREIAVRSPAVAEQSMNQNRQLPRRGSYNNFLVLNDDAAPLLDQLRADYPAAQGGPNSTQGSSSASAARPALLPMSSVPLSPQDPTAPFAIGSACGGATDDDEDAMIGSFVYDCEHAPSVKASKPAQSVAMLAKELERFRLTREELMATSAPRSIQPQVPYYSPQQQQQQQQQQIAGLGSQSGHNWPAASSSSGVVQHSPMTSDPQPIPRPRMHSMPAAVSGSAGSTGGYAGTSPPTFAMSPPMFGVSPPVPTPPMPVPTTMPNLPSAPGAPYGIPGTSPPLAMPHMSSVPSSVPPYLPATAGASPQLGAKPEAFGTSPPPGLRL